MPDRVPVAVLKLAHGGWFVVYALFILVGAVLGTQVVATLIATFGLFMAPIGWKLALFVWGYALTWFLVNDWVKVAAERVFDRDQSGLLSKMVGKEI